MLDSARGRRDNYSDGVDGSWLVRVVARHHKLRPRYGRRGRVNRTVAQMAHPVLVVPIKRTRLSGAS